MMNEAPRPARRGTFSALLVVGATLALTIAAYFEFVSPTRVATRHESFGASGVLQVDYVTSTSPLLNRVVHRELRLSGRDGTAIEVRSPYVTSELWSRRDEFKKLSTACWGAGKSEAAVLYSVLVWMAQKARDEDLNRFLIRNTPIRS